MLRHCLGHPDVRQGEDAGVNSLAYDLIDAGTSDAYALRREAMVVEVARGLFTSLCVAMDTDQFTSSPTELANRSFEYAEAFAAVVDKRCKAWDLTP